ncbi:MAG: CARDB domain-containing protein [Candidatus Woesearchaeota archaeon]
MNKKSAIGILVTVLIFLISMNGVLGELNITGVNLVKGGLVETVPFTYQITATGSDPNTAEINSVDLLDSEGTLIDSDDDYILTNGLNFETTIYIEGNYTFFITVKNDTETSNIFEKNVTVIPALEIIEVTPSEDITLTPGEPIGLDIKVKNNMNRYKAYYPITGIRASLNFDGEEFISNLLGLDAGQEATLHITETLPLNVMDGIYKGFVYVSGKDYEDNTYLHEDYFFSDITVEKNPADLVITELDFEENIISCETKAILNYELTNRGSNNEPFELSVTGGKNFKTSIYGTVESDSTEIYTGSLDIPLENLTLGQSNSFTIVLKYRDGYFDNQSLVRAVTRNSCFLVKSPDVNTIPMRNTATQLLAVNLTDSSLNSQIRWFINDIQTATGREFTFGPRSVGNYQINATINDEIKTWNIEVKDQPSSSNFQLPDKKTIQDNNNGKIVFTSDHSYGLIGNLDSYIIINNNQVSVNNTGGEFSGSATITLFKTFNNPVILYNSGFNTVPTKKCSEAGVTCNIIKNETNELVFTVNGFSTYKVVEEVPAAISISDILISDVAEGDNGSSQLTIGNLGTLEELTNVQYQFVDVDSKYNPILAGTWPITLTASDTIGSYVSPTLTVTVPENEPLTKHSIGLLKVTGRNEDGDTLETNVSIELQPKSFLLIDYIEINGKSSGDLTIEDINEIEVNIKNDYSETIENILVTVRILNVDGDDLEEEVNEFDLRSGKDKPVKVEFDLSRENLDTESYTIEVIVEGTAKDDTEHEARTTKNADLDLESHKLVIENVNSPEKLVCSRDASIQVTVKNLGENEEEDVEVRIFNDELGIDETKTIKRLRELLANNNDEKVSFYLDLANKKPGEYKLELEVYLDGDREDSEDISLALEDCGPSTSTNNVDLAGKKLVDELQKTLLGSSTDKDTGVKTSFRNTTTYTGLLMMLLVMVLLAVVLGMVVLLKKKV